MRKKKKEPSETNINRRRFLKSSTLLTGAALSVLPGTGGSTGFEDQQTGDSSADQQQGESRYNGITLPVEWPPRGNVRFNSIQVWALSAN